MSKNNINLDHYIITGFHNLDHSSTAVRIVLEQNKFRKEVTPNMD